MDEVIDKLRATSRASEQAARREGEVTCDSVRTILRFAPFRTRKFIERKRGNLGQDAKKQFGSLRKYEPAAPCTWQISQKALLSRGSDRTRHFSLQPEPCRSVGREGFKIILRDRTAFLIGRGTILLEWPPHFSNRGRVQPLLESLGKWSSNQDHFRTIISVVYSSKRPFERHSCLWFSVSYQRLANS